MAAKKKRLTQREKARRAEAKKRLQEEGLMRAIGFMVGPDLPQVSPEQVGVLKLLKIAVEYNRFRERLKQEGRTEYNLGELADKVIIPILKL